MEKKDYKLKIDGIDIVEKALYHNNISETDNFNFQVTTQSAADSIKKIIVVLVLLKVTKTSEANELVGKMLVAMGFGLEDFDNMLDKNEKSIYQIPVELENFLKGIAISTCRGIMFSEFKGTVLHRAVLPIILLDSMKPLNENLMEMNKP